MMSAFWRDCGDHLYFSYKNSVHFISDCRHSFAFKTCTAIQVVHSYLSWIYLYSWAIFRVSVEKLDYLYTSHGIWNVVRVIRSLCLQRQPLRPVSYSCISKVYWRYRKQVVEVMPCGLSSINQRLCWDMNPAFRMFTKVYWRLQPDTTWIYCDCLQMRLSPWSQSIQNLQIFNENTPLLPIYDEVQFSLIAVTHRNCLSAMVAYIVLCWYQVWLAMQGVYR